MALVLGLGYELVRANALKAVLALALTVVALAVFVWNDQVNWAVGLVLAIGNMAGAWVAARMATQYWAQVWVYRLLLVVVLVSAVQMFRELDRVLFLLPFAERDFLPVWLPLAR